MTSDRRPVPVFRWASKNLALWRNGTALVAHRRLPARAATPIGLALLKRSMLELYSNFRTPQPASSRQLVDQSALERPT